MESSTDIFRADVAEAEARAKAIVDDFREDGKSINACGAGLVEALLACSVALVGEGESEEYAAEWLRLIAEQIATFAEIIDDPDAGLA